MEVLDTRDIPVRKQHHRSPSSPGDFPRANMCLCLRTTVMSNMKADPSYLLIMTPCHQRLHVKFRIHPGERALETITLRQRSPPRACCFFMMGVVMLLYRASIATTPAPAARQQVVQVMSPITVLWRTLHFASLKQTQSTFPFKHTIATVVARHI